MIQQQIQVGRNVFVVSGATLEECLKNASELQTISKRVPRNAVIEHRSQDGYDFYEAKLPVKIDGENRMAVKQFGVQKDPRALFLASSEPLRVYVKDADYEMVKFDYLTDKVKEWGFDESAVKGFVKARSKKDKAGRAYVPVK